MRSGLLFVVVFVVGVFATEYDGKTFSPYLGDLLKQEKLLYEGENCSCVPYYDCLDELSGAFGLDGVYQAFMDYRCNLYTHRCCPDGIISPEASSTSTNTNTADVTPTTLSPNSKPMSFCEQSSSKVDKQENNVNTPQETENNGNQNQILNTLQELCLQMKTLNPGINSNTQTILGGGVGFNLESSLKRVCSEFDDKSVDLEVVMNQLPVEDEVVNETRPVFVPSLRRSCGNSNPEGIDNKVNVGANYSKFGEFPWMVAVYSEDQYMCGGSLIHPQVVLTTAHCVSIKEAVKVRAGEWDIANTDETLNYQERSITKVIKHSRFVRRILINDIALLVLESPVNLDKHIGTVCLPESGDKPEEQRSCLSTGWGRIAFKDSKNVSILKKVELPMVPRNECEKKLRKTRLGTRFVLDPTFICAGGEADVDTCVGDGGGPLVCKSGEEGNRYKQFGMVAWGIGCSAPIPAAYVNVARYRSWIDEIMSANNFTTSFYVY